MNDIRSWFHTPLLDSSMNARQVSYDMFQYLSRRSSDGCLRVPISSSIEADMIMGECSPIMLSTTVGIATSVDKVNTNDKIATSFSLQNHGQHIFTSSLSELPTATKPSPNP